MTRENAEMVMAIANMSAEEENEFFRRLSGTGLFTEGEIKSFQIVVAYFKMQMHPERTDKIKEAMAKELYAEFNK